MARSAYVLVGLLLCLAPASADDAVFRGDGATVFPVESTDIRMVSERIRLHYREGLGFAVDVDELFENQGPATSLTIGFPFGSGELDLSLENSPDPAWVPESFDPRQDPHFQTLVDGQSIPTSLKRGAGGYDLVFTSSIGFKQGETKRVRHLYTVGGFSDSAGGLTFRYILKTGALWKGSIGRILIYAEIDSTKAEGIHFMSPAPLSILRVGTTILATWDLRDIKPDFDLEFRSLPLFLSRVAMDIGSGNDILDLAATDRIQAEAVGSEGQRFLRNLVLASYGYPFKDALSRAQFYESGYFKENLRFRREEIRTKHWGFIVKTAEREGKSVDPLGEGPGTESLFAADALLAQRASLPVALWKESAALARSVGLDSKEPAKILKDI
jgi:hypothetical protein